VKKAVTKDADRFRALETKPAAGCRLKESPRKITCRNHLDPIDFFLPNDRLFGPDKKEMKARGFLT